MRADWARGVGFDAVFMDVQMPVMNGLEASAAIRALAAEGERPHTPIIALTGFAGPDDRERCLASGMDDFTTKPLAVATALALMRVHVKKGRDVTAAAAGHPQEREASDLDDGATTSAAVAAPPATEDVPSVDPSIFDPSAVLALVGGNTVILKRILKKFDAWQVLQDVRAALAEADAKKLGSVAHAIKGQLSYMQAHTAAESAHALESEAKATAEEARAWSEDSTERLATMTAALCEQVERVEANRRAVLAELE